MAKQWIDPPSGWQYGFPKIYDSEVDGSVREWLIREGYPADEEVPYLRSWMVEEP